MARLRTLKPSFFTNDSLAEIPPLGRLLFQGLWCIADREGRLEDRPRKIKAEVLPYDDVDADAMLNALAEHGFIRRYTAANTRYIQVTNFTKHQSPHKMEAASTIPAPDEHQTSTVQASCDDSLIVGSGYLDPVVGSSSGELTHRDDAPAAQASEPKPIPAVDDAESTATPKTPRELPNVLAERFDAFWAAYPKKVGRKVCVAWWSKRRPSAELTQTILDSIAAHKLGDQWQRNYIKDPIRWLQEERWQDEVPPVPVMLQPRAADDLIVNGMPIPANSRTARNIRVLQDADW